MKDSEKLIYTIRKNIIETLALLSSQEKQREYPVPVEGFCFWFDDYYHPKDQWFMKAFTTQEFNALSEFNECFRTVSEKIGDPPAKPIDLWAIPAWQGIMNKAVETLKHLKN
jgi:hypothetical protein